MNDKSQSDKLKGLSEMMDRMEKENEKKFFEQGDRQAGQKLADLVYFREILNTSCHHEWVSDGCAGSGAPFAVRMEAAPGTADSSIINILITTS